MSREFFNYPRRSTPTRRRARDASVSPSPQTSTGNDERSLIDSSAFRSKASVSADGSCVLLLLTDRSHRDTKVQSLARTLVIILVTDSQYAPDGSQMILSIYLSIHLSIYLSIYLSICLPIYPSIHPSTYLSIYLPICLPTYLSEETSEVLHLEHSFVW
jgi:hypothetical protein